MKVGVKRAIKFYEALSEVAANEGNALVFRGKPMQLYGDKVDTLPSYSQTRNMLVDLGFVKIDHTGGGRKANAVWVLIEPPTEMIVEQRLRDHGHRVQKPSTYKMLAEQVAFLTQEVVQLKMGFVSLQKQMAQYMELENPEPPEGWEFGYDTGGSEPLSGVQAADNGTGDADEYPGAAPGSKAD